MVNAPFVLPHRISLKDFLEKVASNPGIFGKFGIGVPIVIASFQLQGETENKT